MVEPASELVGAVVATDGDARGTGLVTATFLGTATLVLTSVGAAAAPDTFATVHAALSIALFAIGTGAMLWAYALGVSRSRTDLITVPGLFFLAGDVAPPATRRAFRVATAIEVAAVVVAASIRPYSEVAFGILAPMFGLGLMSLWGGRHGTFPPRPLKST